MSHVASRSYLVTILLLGSMCMVSMVSMDLYLPAISGIAVALDTSHKYLQLTISFFMLALAAGQLLYGPLADRYGRRPMFFIAIIIYLTATLFCMFASNVWELILARTFQGAGAAGSLVIALATPRDFEDEIVRAKAFSYINMTIGFSPMLAPIAGAFLYKTLGWQSNFGAMFVGGFIIALFAYFKLFESPLRGKENKIASLNFMTLYKSIAVNKIFWRYALCSVFASAPFYCFLVNSAYLLMKLGGLGPTTFSLLFAANASTLIFGNYLSIFLRKIMGIDKSIFLGAYLIILGAIGITMMMVMYSITPSIIYPIFIASLGTMIILPATSASVLTPFPQNSGSATALLNAIRVGGSAIVASIVGLLLATSIYIYPAVILVSATGILIALIKLK